MKSHLLLACALFFVSAASAYSEDWTQFRGPGGLASSNETNIPVEWSSTENIAWKTELPGHGSSSPTTLGDRIYLTCYTGYGFEPNEGDDDNLKRIVVCLDRASGKIVWTESFDPVLPESEYSGGYNSHHGFSTSTIATDGERLYVFFGKSGVFCLTLDGMKVWHKSVGSGTKGWGSGASPVLHKGLVIVNASVESGSLYALDKMTGEEVWRVDRLKGVWNTPALVKTTDGGIELVYSLPEQIVAVNPDNGENLWTCQGIPDGGYICPSVISHDGIVYAIGGRKNTAIAVRAGGRGDVTKSHELWRIGKGSNVSSPVIHDGHIYWFHENRGVVYCVNAKSGELVFEERLDPSPRLMYASVTIADGKLYCVSQYNGAYVVAAKPAFEQLAHNKFDDDPSRSNASPVISNGQLLLRSDKYLYCIGGK